MSDLSAAQLAELVAQAKVYMQIGDDDQRIAADGVAIFCDASDATAATVQVTDTTVVLIITGGGDAGTTTLTLADVANDTLVELTNVINGTSGWTANLVGRGTIDTDLLIRLAATNALGQSNEVVLKYENETLLELLITDIFTGIETGLCRDILSTTYNEVRNRPSNGEIVLFHPKLTQVTRVSVDTDDAMTVKNTGTGQQATVEVTSTGIITKSVSAGIAASNTDTFASNVSIATMVSTLNGRATWTVTEVNNGSSAWLVQTGAQDVLNRQVTLQMWDDTTAEYVTEYEEGIIRFLSNPFTVSGTGRMYIQYVAGYSELPNDVELVLLDAVKETWEAGTTGGGGLIKERLGDYSYELSDAFVLAQHNAIGTAVDRLRKKYMRYLP